MANNEKIKTNTQSAANLLKILSWLVFFIAGVMVVSVLAVDIMAPEYESPNSSFWPIMVACFAFGAVLLITAKGLYQHLQWARYLAGFISIVSLIAFPIGTFMGLFILSYLRKGWDEA
ncbi:MAG: hypothetical protein ACSHWN_12230 [Methylophilaceae bacterium]